MRHPQEELYFGKERSTRNFFGTKELITAILMI
jgi:hypothetical protein